MFMTLLFAGRGPVDETVYPFLVGGLTNPYPGVRARRNRTDLRTSRILLKALVWLLAGRVRRAYLADGRLYAEVKGSSGEYTTVALSNAELSGTADARPTFSVPNASVNYYGAILLALDAARQGAPDFLAALRPLVALAREDGLSGSEREKAALVLAADELYFAAAYGPTAEADPDRRRLTDPLLLDCVDLPPAVGVPTDLDLSLFDPAARPAATAAAQAIQAGPALQPWQSLPPQPRPVSGRLEAAASMFGVQPQAEPQKEPSQPQSALLTLGAGRAWHKVGLHRVALLASRSEQGDMRETQVGQALLHVALDPERLGHTPELTARHAAEQFINELDEEQAEALLEALEPRVKDFYNSVHAIALSPSNYLVWVRWVGTHINDAMIDERINLRIQNGTW
jgi:hypothetical protein